uniref:Putative secreted protein n=1 Tax=Rhipicephalus microplus TaxID=6941 RepID=A0A6G5A077_RHIMP
MMMTTWTFLLLLFAIHAYPKVHASISSHSFCYRLVPHHITAITTPCRYPCLLQSSYIQPRVHVNYEVDGTPCLIPGSHSAGRHEVSHCIDGVCVQRKSSLALKRSKRQGKGVDSRGRSSSAASILSKRKRDRMELPGVLWLERVRPGLF